MVVSRTVGVEDWARLEHVIRAMLRTFNPNRDLFMFRGDKRQQFDPPNSELYSDAFTPVVDTEKETLTLTIDSPAVILVASRKKSQRFGYEEDEIHFELTFQDPAEAAKAMNRFNEFGRGTVSMQEISLGTVQYEMPITLTSTYANQAVLSPQAQQLLGARLIEPLYNPFRRQNTLTIAPSKGERLVVFNNGASSAINLPKREDEKDIIAPEDGSIFAALILPGSQGAILIAYRQGERPRGWRGVVHDVIGARHDPAFVLGHYESRGDGWDADYD